MEKLFHNLPEKEKKLVTSIEGRYKELVDGTLDHSKLTVREWKGYRFIPSFNPETAARAYKDIEFDKEVVLLAAFPKTGTHWLMEILKQILYCHDGKLVDAAKALSGGIFFIGKGTPQELDLWKYLIFPRKVFATHLPAELVNVEKIKKRKGKIVVLLRNPKDAAVSWFHFTKENPFFDAIRDQLSGDWHRFLDDCVSGKHPLCSRLGEWYPDYILQWYIYKDDPDVMFLHYEDMKRNPINQMKKLASFLNVDLTEERMAEIAVATSFDVMKEKQERKATAFDKLSSQVQFVRKGQVGGWKEMFTVRQSEMMNKVIEDKLGKTGIKFIYE